MALKCPVCGKVQSLWAFTRWNAWEGPAICPQCHSALRIKKDEIYRIVQVAFLVCLALFGLSVYPFSSTICFVIIPLVLMLGIYLLCYPWLSLYVIKDGEKNRNR